MVLGFKCVVGFELVQIVVVQEGSKQGKDLIVNSVEVEVIVFVVEVVLFGQLSFFFINVQVQVGVRKNGKMGNEKELYFSVMMGFSVLSFFGCGIVQDRL